MRTRPDCGVNSSGVLLPPAKHLMAWSSWGIRVSVERTWSSERGITGWKCSLSIGGSKPSKSSSLSAQLPEKSIPVRWKRASKPIDSAKTLTTSEVWPSMKAHNSSHKIVDNEKIRLKLDQTRSWLPPVGGRSSGPSPLKYRLSPNNSRKVELFWFISPKWVSNSGDSIK